MKQNSLVRIIKEVLHNYPIHALLVLIFIIVSSVASVYGSMFMQHRKIRAKQRETKTNHAI